MRAILCRQHGGPETLALADVPDPEPGEGEVVVRVRAAGVNFADGLMVGGRYQERPPLPFIPGLEVAGEVEAAGPGVAAGLEPGRRVLALVDRGGFAERVVARAGDVVPLPTPAAAATPSGWTR
jgi:NADPH2:quinone reductase